MTCSAERGQSEEASPCIFLPKKCLFPPMPPIQPALVLRKGRLCQSLRRSCPPIVYVAMAFLNAVWLASGLFHLAHNAYSACLSSRCDTTALHTKSRGTTALPPFHTDPLAQASSSLRRREE